MDNKEVSDTDQIIPKPSQLRYLEYVDKFPPKMEEFKPLMLLQDGELEDIINEVDDRNNIEEILKRAYVLVASKLKTLATKSDSEVLKNLLSNRPELRRMRNEGLIKDLPQWLQEKIDKYLKLSSDEDSPDENSSDEDSPDENPSDEKSPDENSPNENSSDEKSPDENSSDEDSPDENSSDEDSPDENSSDEKSPDENSPNENSSDEKSPDENSSNEDSPDENSSDEDSPDENPSDEKSPDENSSDEDSPDENSSNEDSPDENSSDEDSPDENSSDEKSPDENSSDEDSSDDDSSNEDSSESEDEISTLYNNLPGEKYVIGFKDDCFRLLSEFSKSKNQNFRDFAEVWKKMGFSAISILYDLHEEAGIEDHGEFLNHAVPEMFLIAKTFMLPEYPKSYRKGALYLLYALYYKQPINTDDALVDGPFAVTFDLTELCLLLQIRDGETEAGKKELQQVFDRMMNDGAISPIMPLHEPADYVNENDLRAWYFTRLLQEHGQSGDLNKSIADYFFEFCLFIKDVVGLSSGNQHSNMPKGETKVKTVRDYLNEFPDPLPTPDPLPVTSSQDCIMEVEKDGVEGLECNALEELESALGDLKCEEVKTDEK